MKRAGPHFHIIGLMNYTAVISPEMMECEDQILKIHGRSNLNGANNRTESPSNKMTWQANKNGFLLSSKILSTINRLRITSQTFCRRPVSFVLLSPPLLLLSTIQLGKVFLSSLFHIEHQLRICLRYRKNPTSTIPLFFHIS